MAITRTNIASDVQLILSNTVYYPTLDLNNSIQDGLDEICAFTGCIYKGAVIPYTAEKTYYDMLTLLPDYIGVVSIFSVPIKRFLRPTSVYKLDQMAIDWEVTHGVPYWFAPINHRYVAIYQKPSAANYGNMYVYYIASAPTLDDTTEIPIPQDYHCVLHDYVLTDLWEQNQEWMKASKSFKNYTSDMDQLRTLVNSRRSSDRIISLK